MSRLDYIGSTKEIQEKEAKADAVLNTLKTKTPDEIRTWVDNNVNNVADVKVMFKRVLIMLAVLSRQID